MLTGSVKTQELSECDIFGPVDFQGTCRNDASSGTRRPAKSSGQHVVCCGPQWSDGLSLTIVRRAMAQCLTSYRLSVKRAARLRGESSRASVGCVQEQTSRVLWWGHEPIPSALMTGIIVSRGKAVPALKSRRACHPMLTLPTLKSLELEA